MNVNKLSLLSLLLIFNASMLFGQGYPWERPLRIAWSNDGVAFNTPAIFQDSSGVPSVIKWKGDTLICAFQWFRAPAGSLSWDRVAVKFSYDNGATWTQPTPIVINGLPANYQRPFDPTLVAVNSDSIRIYYSSSSGFPVGGADSIINTYSAKSIDGINYTFEPNARVDEPSNRVIDPALIYFNNAYHYLSPMGSPQQGAYHYVSPNGLNFTKVPDIISDNNHNWTGNYMVYNMNELRFYGAGPAGIWYNSTANGGMWNGYVNTNIQGGDPSALRVGSNQYLIVYVGQPYATGAGNVPALKKSITIYPNPADGQLSVKADASLVGSTYIIYNQVSKAVLTGKLMSENTNIQLADLPAGIYVFRIGDHMSQTFEVIKQ